MAKRGIGGGVAGVLIGLMITILVGVIVIVNLVSSVKPDATWSSEANNTWAILQSNIWVAFSLIIIAPIIIGAIVIMGYLRSGGFGG